MWFALLTEFKFAAPPVRLALQLSAIPSSTVPPPTNMPPKRQTGKAPPEAPQSPKNDVDPQVMKVNTAYYARVQAIYDVVLNSPQLLTLVQDELLPFPIAVLFFYTWLAGCWLWAHLGALGSWVWARLSRSLLRL